MTQWGTYLVFYGNSSVLSGRNGTQAVPYGFAGGWYRLITQVVFAACHGDESSPLHCVVPFNRTGYICHAPGTAHRPFPTVSLVGGTVQPQKLYMQRPGRQIAAPTIHLFRITVFLTYLSLYCVLSNWETWYIDVGAAICRPPRCEYNLFVQTVSPWMLYSSGYSPNGFISSSKRWYDSRTSWASSARMAWPSWPAFAWPQ